MNKNPNRWFYYSGVLAPILFWVGLLFVGSIYPEYSHYNQAVSELGAKDSPTFKIAPWLINYPSGVLHILFGVGLMRALSTSKLAVLSGVLVVIRGLSIISAGYFYIGTELHALFGFALMLSLVVSSFIWVFISKRSLGVKWFGWFSLVCPLITMASIFLMPIAIEAGEGFGLIQRIATAPQNLWVFVLSIVLLQSKRHNDSLSVKRAVSG